MILNKRFLCVIPARGGSKGLPRKNLRTVGGVSLLSWVCRTALSSEVLDRIICSTDDAEIAALALDEGVDVPFLRAPELAGDRALVLDVLVDALLRVEKPGEKTFDYVVLLQPTSPFVNSSHILAAAKLAVESDADTVISGYLVGQRHPQIMFYRSEEGAVEWYCETSERMARRQDLPSLYSRSGLLYIIKRATLLERRQIYGCKIMAIEVDADEGLCIDTETDLDVAETILARNPKQTLRIDQSKNAVVDAPVEQMFNSTWVSRPESEYVHWTRGELTNQIQLVFRNHWELFSQIMQRNRGDGLRSLEVGCGRGSLSCYFADAGYEVTLLDSSPSVLETAKEIYSRNGLSGFFHAGDALSMPFESESFDVVFSIGLLEHFDNIQSLVAEQARVLRPGGYLFIYTVPDKEVRVQDEFSWVNDLLSSVLPQSSQTNTKPVLYRNKILGSSYVEILNEMGFKNAQSSGVYPLPMISNSLDFPFTIMSPACEEVLVRTFNKILNRRAAEGGGHPWLCAEDYGQAILIWGTR